MADTPPVRTHLVEPSCKGMRLDLFLARVEPDLSRSRLKALIESGAVLVAGANARPALLLKGGEIVSVAPPAPRAVALEAEDIPLDILYEDADLVVLDKAAGLVVHPGAGNASGTLVNALLSHCGDLAGIGGELRPGIVHRLDKETSGCLVVAKSERALMSLQDQFRGHLVEKRYVALVHGAPALEGRFETLHGRHPTDRLRFTSHVQRGRTAVTEWRRAEVFQGISLVHVHLLTGRTHQIRMHFGEAGFPLLADGLYGGRRLEKRLAPQDAVRRAAEALGRQALHAARIAFDHPITGRRLDFEAPLPADFEAALHLLREAPARQ